MIQTQLETTVAEKTAVAKTVEQNKMQVEISLKQKQEKYEKDKKGLTNCNTCLTKCEGKSNPKYDFKEDLKEAIVSEKRIVEIINKNTSYYSERNEKTIMPDITAYTSGIKEEAVCHLEIKNSKRTFMAIEYCVKSQDLSSYESLTFNTSDLIRYFEMVGLEYPKEFRKFLTQKIKDTPELLTMDKIRKPFYVVWVLKNRPCILGGEEEVRFSADIQTLHKIFLEKGFSRQYKRKAGKGDYDENGVLKGVLNNYHFSIHEVSKGMPKRIKASRI